MKPSNIQIQEVINWFKRELALEIINRTLPNFINTISLEALEAYKSDDICTRCIRYNARATWGCGPTHLRSECEFYTTEVPNENISIRPRK